MSLGLGAKKANIGPYAAFLSGSKSSFLPDHMPPIESYAPDVCQKATVLPKSGTVVSFGNRFTLELNQQMPQVTGSALKITIGPLSVTGGTYAYFTDYFLIWLIDRLTWRDPNNGPLQIYGPNEYYKDILLMNPERQRVFQNQSAGNLTTFQRSALAAQTQVYYFIMPDWFNAALGNDRSYTVNAQNIDVPIQIEIELAALNRLVVTDGTNPTCTISISWELEGRIPTQAELNTSSAVLNSPDGQIVNLMDHFTWTYPQTIASGFTGTVVVPLDAITGPVNALHLFFRSSDEVLSNNGSVNYTNFNNAFKPTRIAIKTGTEYVLDPIDVSYLLTQWRQRGYPSSYPEQDVVHINFNVFPEFRRFIKSGYYDFNYIGNGVVLELQYDTAPGVAVRVDILANLEKWIQQQGGSIRAIS